MEKPAGNSAARSASPLGGAPGLALLIIPIVLLALPAAAPADGGEGDGESPFAFNAYGEALYSRYDYGPDQKSGTAGSPPDSRAAMDIPRFVFELEYHLRDDLYFEAEVEYEHGGAGVELELEYEEFGEYEVEVEQAGEVRLEQMFLAKRFGGGYEARAGRIIIPVGMANRFDRPGDYFGAVRSESERTLIPVTWSEIGVSLSGSIRGLAFQLLLINALDSSGFSSKQWIAGGNQRRFEQVRATDLAGAVALRRELAEGVLACASAYRGNSTGNRPKKDMEGIDAPVTIAEVHGRVDRGPWIARGQFLAGRVENAGEISAKNSRLSVNLGVARTPVARGARLWFVEAGVDLLALRGGGGEQRIIPFVRYESYDTMHETGAGTFDDPRFERTTVTAGLNYEPGGNVVLKSDYSHRTLGDERFNDENTWSVGFGFRAGAEEDEDDEEFEEND